jgi:DNA primase
MIKQESIKKLKEKVDILAIVQQYLPNLKRSGKNYFALCPFHSERTPSFSVAPDKGIIHCFGCGYTADIIKFVQDMEHISYVEAVEKIANKISFTLEYVDAEQQRILKEKYDEQKVLLDLLTNLAEVYHNILLNEKIASEARNYLASRGIKLETIKQFKLGFAPDGNFISRNYKDIKELKDFDLSTLHKAGVISFKTDEDNDSLKKYEHPFDYFRNRIMFPIFNISGKVVSFGGRILPGMSTALDIPIYLNGPQTLVFNKGNFLYGVYQAKDYIVREKSVIFVEGYMDVIVLFQEGIKNVVAPLGTALTEQQIKLCKRFLDISCGGIYILFDPDEAGAKATISASQVVFSSSGYPQIVMLAENIDPDEYILKYGCEKFKKLISESCSVVKFVVRNYLRRKNVGNINSIDIREKIRLLKELLELSPHISNPLVKSEFIKEISQELKVDERIIRSEQLKFYRPNGYEKLENILEKRPYTCEEELLWICIHYPELINEIEEELFSHDNKYYEIFKKLKQNKDITEIIESLESPLKELVIRMVYDEKNIGDSVEEKVKQLYSEIYRIKYIKRYKELKPIVEDMLNEKIPLDCGIVNEFKQIVEILKLDKNKQVYNVLSND